MPWNWELPNWPIFSSDPSLIAELEKRFLLGIGSSFAFLKTISQQERAQFVVEILCMEGLESSKIEGEFLSRESLQSSIKQYFGLQTTQKMDHGKESGLAELLCSVYESFQEPLTDEMLFLWHYKLLNGQGHIADCGIYRTHIEPMQIVSHRYDSPVVFFEAPPSIKVSDEMAVFIRWFNSTRQTMPVLQRAAMAHVYFESIHPFEDGNGRLGRVLVEKVLSQGFNSPILVSVSKVLEKRKKEYYEALASCNRTLEIDRFVIFFAEVVLQAQEEAMNILYFLIEKAKLLQRLAGQLNARQEKVLLRIFAEGVNGFKGGLSAENYISITKTSKATATRDLVDLVQKGALVKTGDLRYTRYWLNLPNHSFSIS